MLSLLGVKVLQTVLLISHYDYACRNVQHA